MSASDLLRDIQALPRDTPLDWTGIRNRIHDEAAKTSNVEERVLLLSIYKLVMDEVEPNITSSAEDAAKFREARAQDYRLLLMPEMLVGQNVSVELANIVTQREVDAGRMAPNDSLRQLATSGASAPFASIAELQKIEAERVAPTQRHGVWRTLVGKLVGR